MKGDLKVHKQNNKNIISLGCLGAAIIWILLILSVADSITVNAEEDEANYYYYNSLYESEDTLILREKTIETNLKLAILNNGSRTVEYPLQEKAVTYTMYQLFADTSSNGTVGANVVVHTIENLKTGKITDIGSNKTTTIGYVSVSKWNENVLNGIDTSNAGVERTGLTTNIPVFYSVEEIEHYFETGYNPNDITDEFTDNYDPEMPVPELGNIKHSGFTVLNAPSGNYYLQLKIESTVYGLQLRNKTSLSYELARNMDWVYGQQTKDLGTWDVPVSNQAVYNLKSDWDYDNIKWLTEKASQFFDQYPKINKLPDYSMLKHSGLAKDYTMQHVTITSAVSSLSDDTQACVYLNKSLLPTTKYYVRYVKYDKSEDGTYEQTNSQWMSYKVGFNLITTSPVEGNPVDGSPIETDPITGIIDDDGNPDYGGDTINTENPIEMVMGFIEFLKELPSLFGDLTAFLAESFTFVPQKFWEFILVGVGFMVVLVIFKLVRG